MTPERLTELSETTIAACLTEMRRKNADYTKGCGDALYNFKEQARRLGLSPMQVWQVHYGKHQLAIETFCEGKELASEGIDGRIMDTIVYALLLKALIEDLRTEAI